MLLKFCLKKNPDGYDVFLTRPRRSCGPPSFLHSEYKVIPGGKAPRLKKEYTYTHTPPLGLHEMLQGQMCFTLLFELIWLSFIHIHT